YWYYDRHRSVRLVILVGLAIDQIAQSGLSSLSVIYYSAQLFSARSLFLSVPRTFRLNSFLYRFFGKKIMVYTITYMVVIVLLALFNRVYYNSPLPFAFMIILTTICCGVVMHLDFGRYQLSLLTSAISTFKSNRLNS
ncbi:hypothetical protein ACO1ZV_22095, partial [Enterobacter kobei]